jgi:hypothetical protein
MEGAKLSQHLGNALGTRRELRRTRHEMAIRMSLKKEIERDASPARATPKQKRRCRNF